ncbi:fimbrillin family protein [Hoylesella buccalis]|uniref:Lipoprotein n=1 Tax=Hoylesella buccalis DNF00853 TaxID=1401074 RepID=A0A095ZJ37_9BACT|nr:fimbrillin family protein [Hoylesella buccalis]KGF34760.1 hypothetical protein HMPREF2137_06225 [Hoylesella buccalis DNF00853]
MKNLFYNCKTIGAASILCLAAMATSCSQDLEEGKVQTDNNPAALNVVKLNFATSALTRGTMYDDKAQMPDDATFGVYGYGHKDGEASPTTPNFINNGSAKKDGVVRVKGEVATYKTKMPKVQLAAVYPQLNDANQFKKTGANTYTFTYSLQKDMAQQKDLMIGQTDEFEITSQNPAEKEISSGKTINMHHALTAINFAIGDRVPTGYTIEGIRLTNLYTKGTCNVDLSKNTDAERFTWEDLSEKKDVYIITNHITTTQVNRTQFTGVKTGNKYDNLTIFMIPQQVGDDAKAEVILKKDEKEYKSIRDIKGEKVTPENDTRVKIKRITIPLKRKDEKPYIAGEVVKYLVSSLTNKTKEKDSNISIEVVDPNNYEKTNKYIKPNKESFCKKDREKQNTYNVYINCYRYAVNTDKSNKHFNYAITAPNTFKIESVTYLTYKGKDPEYLNMPENSVTWEITKQPNGDSTIGSFSLTFNPKNYPKVTNKLTGKGKYIPQPHKLGSKDAIYITLVADGFEDNELKITCKDFPK